MADKLPEEIISHVLGYVSVSDRKEACLVCKRWYLASLHPALLTDTVVTFRAPTTAADLISRLGKRKTPHLVLDQIDGSIQAKAIIEDACHYLAENLQSLTLKGSNITEGVFMALIKNCHSLSSLNLSCCNSLFMTGQIFSKPDDVNQLKTVLQYVKVLNLSNIRYLSDVILNRFLEVCPNVENLILSGNQISFHSDLYNRRRTASASMSVLTFTNIEAFLRKKGGQMKSLTLSRTTIDDESLKTLAEIPGLNLKEMVLVCCRDVTDEGIGYLVKAQTSLESLDVSQCTSIGDQAVSAISAHLGSLKNLNLSKCRLVSDQSVSRIKQMPSLENLDLSSCYTITSGGLKNGLSPQLVHLTTLILHGCSLVRDSFLVHAAKCLPRLLHLDLASCSITDVGLYFVCKYLRGLQHLSLAWCRDVTDAGILGRPLGVSLDQHLRCEDHGSCKCTRRGFGKDVLNLPKIQDKSTLTEVKDSRALLLEEDDADVHQVSDLCCLRQLHLTACAKLTDQAIQALRLPCLEVLDVSLCVCLTDASLLAAAWHLPSLARLSLGQCGAVTDAGVAAVARRNTRLTHLDIAGCDRLTDAALAELTLYSRRLRVLDVSLCGGISAAAADRAEASLPHLHTLHRRLLAGGQHTIPQ